MRLLHSLAKTRASFDDPNLVSHVGLVAGMSAGADSIDDMDLLRHGTMSALFGGIHALSTLGSHLRSYTWGTSAAGEDGREFLANLAAQAPLLAGADVLAFLDIDSMQKRVYGHKKQGASFGHTKILGKSSWPGVPPRSPPGKRMSRLTRRTGRPRRPARRKCSSLTPRTGRCAGWPRSPPAARATSAAGSQPRSRGSS